MGIDLDNGSIHSEQFHVDSNGSAGFSGTINLTYPSTSTRGESTINLSPSTAKIVLEHASKTISSTLSTPSGRTEVSSEGIYIEPAGLKAGSIGSSRYSSIVTLGNKDAYEYIYSGSPKGYNFITGIYAIAPSNNATPPTNYRLYEAYGAVIENLRTNGVVEWPAIFSSLYSSSSPGRIPSKYTRVLCEPISGTMHLLLPENPLQGQVVKVSHPGTGSVRIYSDTPNYSNIVFNGGTNAYINVDKNEEFFFTGLRWILTQHD